MRTMVLMSATLTVACASAPAATPVTLQPPPPTAGPVAAAPATATASAPPARDPAQQAADEKFLADWVATRGWTLGLPVSPQPTPDGTLVVFLRAQPRSPALALYAFEVGSGKTREIVTPEQLLAGAQENLSPEERARRERQRVKLAGFTSFAIAPDSRSLLTSLSGRVYRVPLDGGAPIELAGPDGKGAAPFDARLSSDGKRVGFVRGGELWVTSYDGAGKPVQITKGAGGAIEHAQAEFVAQEEMDRAQGWWFSPDASQLVWQRSDASKVEMRYLGDPVDPFQVITPTPYPRPGRANVDVTLAVSPVKAGGKPVWIEWDRAKYPYLARVRWDEGAPLTVQVMSRDQRELSVLAVDAKTGKTRELVHEHDDVFLNLHNHLRWLPGGRELLWASEKGGDWQLELRGADGTLVRALTPVGFGFRAVEFVDPAGQYVVVQAAAEQVDAQLWRVPLAGGEPVALTPREVVADAVYARAVPVYVLSRTSEADEHLPEVFRADGSSAGVLPSSAEASPITPQPKVQKVGERGFWTVIVRPRDFDATKKYPVLVNVYGGPHATMVNRARRAYVMQQWIADHGYIVVSIDGRGTPKRGREWERAIFGKFSEVPLEDQVAGLQALAATEPAMDLGRVGIWGGSFGGFMSALAVLRRPDVYKAGVAIAPVADWLDYDTCYTERYLGVPNLEDTTRYDVNGLLPYVDDLTRPLLVIHGTADDNVHFSHALELADALLRAGKPFDFLPLARQTHGPREPKLLARYYQRIFDFFRDNL